MKRLILRCNELKENFNGMSIEINKKKKLQQLEQVANLSTYPSRLFNSFCYDDDDDDDEEYTIAITPVLPTEEPDNSLIPNPNESRIFPITRNDDESFSDEDVPKEIYSNPLFDEEIISTKIDPLSTLMLCMIFIEFFGLNLDTSIISSHIIDSISKEFLPV
ncbi:hypothetical protein Tco_0660538 [Tanacetum coccineum]